MMSKHLNKNLCILILVLTVLIGTVPIFSQRRTGGQRRGGPPQTRQERLFVSNDPADHPASNFERAIERKAETDRQFEDACAGVIDYQKISYPSRIGDLDIPAYVFQPLEKRGEKGHAAMVWVHGGVHSNLGFSYFRFIEEAVKRGYVIVCPEYRGSTGYGEEFHKEIDYGGYEVDDCISAYDYIKENLPHVDPERIGMMGWSHGGLITCHALFRPGQTEFKCGAAIVPVTNLIFRLSYKGPGYQRSFATQKRIQGLPFEKREEYVKRSPVYHVDNLEVPLLCHVATNDQDVNFVECEAMINALRAKKPLLSETKVYVDPPYGHSFSRRGDSPDLKDSWDRTWTFFEWNLKPNLDPSKKKSDVEINLDPLARIHRTTVFADMHAHPDRFHRANINRISPVELDRYRRGLIDVVVCCVSSDAAYQGGYTKRDGTNVRRLRAGQDYSIKPGFAFEFTLDRLERVYQTIADDENVALASSPWAVLRAKRQGQITLIPALEGADGLEGSLENLNKLYDQGLRLLQLVHFRANELGYIQTPPYQAGGLTDFGTDVIRQCNRLGIIIDLAHAHKQTTLNAVKISEDPVIFSHTGVKALYQADRCLDDEEIKAIASTGGLIGIWPSSSFKNIDVMIQHFDYVKNLVGIDHIGIGSDLRGMSYLPEFGQEANFRAIGTALLEHGYSPEDVGKIMGGNFFRIWRQISQN